MRHALRLVVAALLLSLMAPFASAYYYWIYFTGRSAPFAPIPAKFDINSLPNQTIPYLISSQGPAVMMPGDTFPALISQIRAAANVWNGVSTSAAKLSFGGLSPMSQPDVLPEVNIVFDDDMAPGLLAVTRLNMVQDVSGTLAAGAQFVPVLGARIQLHNDLTMMCPYDCQASWSDRFFLTLVHEFGHALGLQHTLTSSVMSTEQTRSTTKAVPLAADDIAGVSLLYPANGFAAKTGTITGAVTLRGAPVSLASVVALSTNGIAVSALTNPDGTYRIDGIPAGSYYVYAHPLPPAPSSDSYAANVIPPQDANGGNFLAVTGFGTQFFGGTTDWSQSTQIGVEAGKSVDGINFNVPQRSNGPAITAVAAYTYLAPGGGVGYDGLPGATLVSTGPMLSGTSYYVYFAGVGVSRKNVSKISVSVVGDKAKVIQAPLVIDDNYLYIAVKAAAGATANTPTALAISMDNDVYVLPGAFSVVPAGPPSITSVNGNTDGSGNTIVAINGANLNSSTKILFDGALASSVQLAGDGTLYATAPPATNGHRAIVEALAADSQTSAQLLGTSQPPSFTYAGPGDPSISMNPPQVAAGTDAQVDIIGVNTNFDSTTAVGFGTSDIAVKQFWVLSPGLLRMNISVNSGAAVVPTTVSVASGLQLATLSTAFQVLPLNPALVTLRTPIVNQATNLPGVPVGGTAVINTSGLPFTATSATLAGWILSIANQPIPFTVGDRGQIVAQIPATFLTGPTIVQLTAPGGVVIPPVLMQVDPPPPEIRGAAVITNGPASAAPAPGSGPVIVHGGDLLALTLVGLADAFGNFPDASAIEVSVGGISVTPSALVSLGGPGFPCQLRVTLPSNLAAGPQTIAVKLGTRVSAAFPITVQ